MAHEVPHDAPGSAATRAVVLARGLGRRMRVAPEAGAPATALAAAQRAAAESGVKGMIPIGRPFLDYLLGELADAGFTDACLVIGPEHDAVRDYYTAQAPPRRIRVHFAEQAEPLGTADAVLAAEELVGGEPFVVLNSDNHYPASVLARLRTALPPALIGFDPEGLGAAHGGNVPPERVNAFALLGVGADGSLRTIIEKPDGAARHALGRPLHVSMNCWLFTPEIFDACRSIGLSERGELELPHAVQWLVDRRGAHFTVLSARVPVLDLSTRADIPAVAALLAGRDPCP